MGSRIVDVLLGIEDTFGIDLDQSRLVQVETLEDLHDLVVSHLDGASAPYPSPRRFRELRRTLEEIAPPHVRCRPSTAFDAAVPRRRRRRVWSDLRRRLTFRLPGLCPPLWVERSSVLSVLAGVVTLATGHLALGGAFALASCALYVGLSTGPPRGCRTLRDVVYLSLAIDPPSAPSIGPSEVWGTMVALIALYSDVPAERMEARSRLVELIP